MSLATGESRALMEQWSMRRRLGFAGDVGRLPARLVDGLLTLEAEREKWERATNG